MVYIVPRSAWGAKPAKQPEEGSWAPWNGGVVIHHHGSGDGYPKANHQDCYNQVLGIQDQAMNVSWFEEEILGKDVYDDIPYNFLVCQHGWVFEGRGLGVRSAANGREIAGSNQNYFAVMGMIELDDAPSQAMLTSIKELIAQLRQEKTWPAGKLIKGHRELLSSKECPGQLFPYVTNGSLEPSPPAPVPVPVPVPASVPIYSRADWGARPPNAVTWVEPSARTGFTVHYSAGPSSQTPRQIQNYHMDSNSWVDIGYNFLVDRAGRVYEGRGWYVEGAHATSHNTTHIGVCFIGRDGEATAAALSAVRALYTYANQLTNKTLARTWHGGLPGQSTECPGSSLRAWVQGGMVGDDVPVTGGSGDTSGGGMSSVRTVAAQQRAVNGLGHSPAIAVDGLWGPKTDAGVRWLQTKVGVTSDGLWGPGTEAAYRAATGDSATGGMASVRSITKQQSAVNGLGHSPAIVVDGLWGPKTDAGVRWLQTKVGVTSDGLWGPGTEAAYNAYLDEGALLTVDGAFGAATIEATQRAIGVTADGQWGPGSIRGLQNHLNTWSAAGLTVDGAMGPGTIRALQRHLNTMVSAGLTVDGLWGSATVSALQRALNLAKF
ncbi:N-acetylmuramoyl-L-alanine amidase [Streptomyces sp. NBC_01314]|uniref:peptidoglycan recognition protein family protein n=1 Tax=Streptomyces sp. NBC_01314 TaxID=2903821 RepID=UPI00308EFED3|nr:N-acetylmuramoyl-L-alanine amidase [Streptomyces sp. NBC_01314]